MCPTPARDGAKVLENPQRHFCTDGLLLAIRPRTDSRSGDTTVPSGTPSCCELSWPGLRSHPHSPTALPLLALHPQQPLPLRGLGQCRSPREPSAERPPPGLLLPPRSCAWAPSSLPDSHGEGGFTQEEEPGEKISSHHPLWPAAAFPSLSPSGRQVAAWLRPCSLPRPSRQPVLLLALG